MTTDDIAKSEIENAVECALSTIAWSVVGEGMMTEDAVATILNSEFRRPEVQTAAANLVDRANASDQVEFSAFEEDQAKISAVRQLLRLAVLGKSTIGHASRSIADICST